jgi:hypothetical protein
VTMKRTLFSSGDRNILLPSAGIKSEVAFSFEDASSVFLRNALNFNKTKRHNIPGDSNLLTFNPKSLALYIVTCQSIVGLRNRDYATERC